ncbi:MAG: hypothetical protein WD601_14420, partial [Pseudohongiellaceae bacterium]
MSLKAAKKETFQTKEVRYMKAPAPSQTSAAQIASAARKALIAANAAYYSWSPPQQERFRATMDDAAANRVEAVLLKDLLGIECTAEKAGEIWQDQPTEHINTLNWAKLLTTGIGEDKIFLNEWMEWAGTGEEEGEQKDEQKDEQKKRTISLLDFNTLYDYDYAHYLFQEQENQKEYKRQKKAYEGLGYYALRFSLWARLLIDERFYYATLYSLPDYLKDETESRGDDIIQNLIPHD